MSTKTRQRILSALAALAAMALWVPAAHAGDAKFEGNSASGDKAFFSTVDPLASGDTDHRRDLYVRYFDEEVVEGGAYVTRLVSFGPSGGNSAFDATFDGSSEDGVRVFFSTGERLTTDDTDTSVDVYMRDLDAKTTTRVSRNGNGAFDANFAALSSDGTRAFFSSKEQLTTDDTDASVDVFVRDVDAETTVRVSRGGAACEGGGCGNGAFDAGFLGASEDGTRAAFASSEPLLDQPEAAPRIYLRDLSGAGGGTTHLVSAPGTCPPGLSAQDCNPSFGGLSADGSHVFFETSAQLAAGDDDESQDVYSWSGGAVVRASTGPSGGNGSFNALFAGALPDGSAVFFETGEQLDPGADADGAQDVYRRDLGAAETEVVSQGESSCQPGCGNGAADATVVRRDSVPSGVATGGGETRIFFFSKEQLTEDDTDSSFDVFARALSAEETVRVSRGAASCEPQCGNGAFDANFSALAGQGSLAYFVTPEPLAPQDTDTAKDIYERDLEGGATSLVSEGDDSSCKTPPCGNGPSQSQLHGVSGDGAVAFLVSEEHLTADADFAADDKVYAREGNSTRLVSTGNQAGLELGPAAPFLFGTDPVSPGESTTPRVEGSAEPGSSIKLYSTSDCSGEPVATGTAEDLADPGILVTVEPESTSNFRATAEAEGFISPCSNEVEYEQWAFEPWDEEEESKAVDVFPKPTTRHFATPITRITFGPAFKTRLRRPVFRFTDSTGQPGTSFVCKLDRRAWESCGSPTKLRKLSPGKHVFRVRGVNAVGVEEEGSIKRSFKLVRG